MLAEPNERVVTGPSQGALSVDMADKDREEIAARLRALQQALNATDQQMALDAGVSRQAWANYVSRKPANRRTISIDAVRNLKKALGDAKVTGEWIFLGESSSITDEAFRRKLVAAQASPVQKRPGRRPHHR